jgi:hypothetical protein
LGKKIGTFRRDKKVVMVVSNRLELFHSATPELLQLLTSEFDF